MSLGRREIQPMDLAAFRMKELEVDHVDAQGRPVFRHRRSLRAVLARLRERWDAARTRANPEPFQRPSDRA
jgi:hypothetical protein